MMIRHLISTTLVAISYFNSVEASFFISQKTSHLFTSGKNNCTSYATNPNDVDEYYFCLNRDGAQDINSSCTKNIKKNLMDLGCTEEFSNSFTRAYNIDNLQAHKDKLLKIKSEFESFKEKGLTASAQVSKYLNYIKINALKDLVDVDPEIQRQMRDNEAKFRSRKNSCSDVVNLKDPLSLDSPRDQGAIGWCYAYTASDLLSHALGEKVSAVQLAGLFNETSFGKTMAPSGEGGNIDLTLEAAQKHGVCLESDMPSNDNEYSNISVDLQRLFQATRELGAQYYQHERDFGKTSRVSVSNEQLQIILCEDFKYLLDGYQLLFPRLSIEQISEHFLKSGIDAFTQMTKSCAIQKDNRLTSLKIRSEMREKKLYSTIDEQLNKGNILGIYYDPGMLNGLEKLDSTHISSIVGRRFNEETMSCEYLLRNSWGTSCGVYLEDYECKNGHIWIGEEFFKHNNSVVEVNYVENK